MSQADPYESSVVMWPTNINSWLSYVKRKVSLTCGQHRQSKSIHIISASATQFTILYNHFFPCIHELIIWYSSMNKLSRDHATVIMTIAIIIETNNVVKNQLDSTLINLKAPLIHSMVLKS